MALRAFLAALAPVAARQPQVFVEACRATVEIKGGWPGCMPACLHVCLLCMSACMF